MAKADLTLDIGTNYHGQGMQKLDTAIKGSARQLRSATKTVQAMQGALGQLGGTAGRVAGLFGAFASGGIVGVAIAAATAMVTKLAEAFKKAKEAAEDAAKAAATQWSKSGEILDSVYGKKVKDIAEASGETKAAISRNIKSAELEKRRNIAEGYDPDTENPIEKMKTAKAHTSQANADVKAAWDIIDALKQKRQDRLNMYEREKDAIVREADAYGIQEKLDAKDIHKRKTEGLARAESRYMDDDLKYEQEIANAEKQLLEKQRALSLVVEEELVVNKEIAKAEKDRLGKLFGGKTDAALFVNSYEEDRKDAERAEAEGKIRGLRDQAQSIRAFGDYRQDVIDWERGQWDNASKALGRGRLSGKDERRRQHLQDILAKGGRLGPKGLEELKDLNEQAGKGPRAFLEQKREELDKQAREVAKLTADKISNISDKIDQISQKIGI